MGEEIVDSVAHFIKHLLGLCGEPHPSLLIGGAAFIGMIKCTLASCVKRKKEK